MPLNNFLHSCCFNTPGAQQQFPAFIWFYMWCPRGLPCASQQFPALMRFQYLSLPPGLYTVSCMHRHLGSISRFLISPLPPASLSPIFCGNLASIFTCPPVSFNTFLRASCFDISMPPSCASRQFPGIHFFVPKFSPASLNVFLACIFMCPQLVSTSTLHPSSQHFFAFILFQHRFFPSPYALQFFASLSFHT